MHGPTLLVEELTTPAMQPLAEKDAGLLGASVSPLTLVRQLSRFLDACMLVADLSRCEPQ